MHLKCIIYFVLFLCLFIVADCSIMNESILNYDNSSPEVTVNSGTKKMTIDTVPEDADIYINNKYTGTGQVILEDMLPGVYKIEIEKNGYKKINTWINYNGEDEIFLFTLERIVGKISIITDPEDATVILGGKEIQQGETTVPVGTYILDISCFGYENLQNEVIISENETTYIDEHLLKASFRIDNFHISRAVLNPDNPGLMGQVEISFYVFSYGTGKLNITDSEGKEIFFRNFGRFTSWEQSLIWKGNSSNGTTLPDGQYTVNLELTSEETGELSKYSENIQIDRNLLVNFRNGFSGNSGLLFTAVPGVLPKRNMQLSTIFTGHFEKKNTFLVYNAPMNLHFRFGLGRNLELNFNAGLILKDSTELPYLFSSSLRFHYLKLKNSRINFNSAVTGKIAFLNKTGDDIFTNFTGLSFGNPFELKTGPFSFILNPEFTISFWDITHNNSYNNDPGFYLWFYCRTGILLDFGFISTGLSFAARTNAVSRDFGFDLPLHSAFEINYLIPGTKLYLSLYTIAEIEDGLSIFGGGGLGYLSN
jgi:hypothetical protein